MPEIFSRISLVFSLQINRNSFNLTGKEKTLEKSRVFLLPVAGVEPARCYHQRILSPSRLPIPTHRLAFTDIFYHKTFRYTRDFCLNSYFSLSLHFYARSRTLPDMLCLFSCSVEKNPRQLPHIHHTKTATEALPSVTVCFPMLNQSIPLYFSACALIRSRSSK